MHLVDDNEFYRAAFPKDEEWGFDFFFKKYHTPLIFFAHSIVADTDTAMDIVEDSFLKLWERREQLGPKGSLKSYLYKIVHNECIDHDPSPKNRTPVK